MTSFANHDEIVDSRIANAFFTEAAPHLNLDAIPDRDQLMHEVSGALRQIESLENAKNEGAVKVVAGGYALSIRESSWILLKSALGLLLLTVGPEGFTKVGGAGIIIEAMNSCRELIKTLDPTDQLVCAAIAEKRLKKQRVRDPEIRVTKDDIISFFRGRDEDEPMELDKILDELVGKKIIERCRENDSTFYSVKF